MVQQYHDDLVESNLLSLFSNGVSIKTYFSAWNLYSFSNKRNNLVKTDLLVDNIFVVFAGKVFHQIVGIPMGTNCDPLLADIFLYSYEAEFI